MTRTPARCTGVTSRRRGCTSFWPPEEQGTAFFLGGHLGPKISEHVNVSAAKAGMSRRAFLGSASALPAALLAVNRITGMKFFDVTRAEAARILKVSYKTLLNKIADCQLKPPPSRQLG